jgi:hypothetical protein
MSQSIANQLEGIQKNFTDAGGSVNWAKATPAMVNYVRRKGYDLASVADAANIMSADEPGNVWDVNRVEELMAQFPGPEYGLGASLGSIQTGKKEASDILGRTMTGVEGDFTKGQALLNPFISQGAGAASLQAALSGAMGVEAQQKAFQDYQMSPGVSWAQQQGEKALLRNSAATGGLRGGNVLKALQEHGTGIALQDYGNQFSRLGELAQRGYGASTTGAGMYSNQAGIRANLGGMESGQAFNAGIEEARLQQAAALAMAQNMMGATSALAGLQEGAGNNASGQFSGQAANLAELQSRAAQGDAQARQQLAAALAGNNQNAGAQMGGTPVGGGSSILGGLASVAGGLSGLSASTNKTSSQPIKGLVNNAATGYGPNYNVPYNPNYSSDYLRAF